jgi:hypothetical protein
MKVIQENINGTVFNKVEGVLCWRLIHDGKKVISLFESSGTTMTSHEIFIATTEAECQTEIYALNLEYNTSHPEID